MPKTSPYSSLKNGPTVPSGRFCSMSETFFRTWYQASGICRGRRRIEELDVDDRLPRRRVALDDVEVGRLLQLLLERVGQLVHRVDERGAGPGSGHDHGADRERGILLAAEIGVGESPRCQEEDHEEEDEDPVPDRPGREIPRHGVATFSTLTICPSASELTPAMTTRSPFSIPSEISTAPVS